MLVRPFGDRPQVVVVGQFVERLAPIVPNGAGLGADVADQRRKVRRQVVAPALAEFLQQVRRPVGVEHFQAVAENRVRRVRSECLHQPVAHVLQMILDGGAVVMVEHVTLRANGRALHHLPRAAGYEKQHDPRLARATARAERLPVAFGNGDLPDAGGGELLGVASGHKHGQQFLAVLQVWHADRRSAGLAPERGRTAAFRPLG